MDPNMYWASGQSVQYSAVSCQMAAVGPATTWTSTMPNFPPHVMPYQPQPVPISQLPGPKPPPGTMHSMSQGLPCPVTMQEPIMHPMSQGMPCPAHLPEPIMHSMAQSMPSPVTMQKPMAHPMSQGMPCPATLQEPTMRPMSQGLPCPVTMQEPMMPPMSQGMPCPVTLHKPFMPPPVIHGQNFMPMRFHAAVPTPKPPMMMQQSPTQSIVQPMIPRPRVVVPPPTEITSPQRPLRLIIPPQGQGPVVPPPDAMASPPPAPLFLPSSKSHLSVTEPPEIMPQSPTSKPPKSERKKETQLTSPGKEMPAADTGLMGCIHKKYEDLFLEHGSMEPTDQRVLTCFIQLSKEERKIVMACGSIKSFLTMSQKFVLVDNVIRLTEEEVRLTPTPEYAQELEGQPATAEELFAMKAYKAGISVQSPKLKSNVTLRLGGDLSQRFPGDGQSDPAMEMDNNSQEDGDDDNVDESPDPGGGKGNSFNLLRKTLISYLQEEDDHHLLNVRKNLYVAINKFTDEGSNVEQLLVMINMKNSIIATKSSSLCKMRIEEVSDIMNNFYSKLNKNGNNEADLDQRLHDLKLESNISPGVNDDFSDRSEVVSPTGTPDSMSVSSRLNVHSTEFVPRSPGTPTVHDKLSSLQKKSKDTGMLTSKSKCNNASTSTRGMIHVCNIGTMTVFSTCHKGIQTEALPESAQEKNDEETRYNEQEYEEVLYRAMVAEERLLHVQRDLNVLKAECRMQEFESVMPSERARNGVAFIEEEIARIEAVFDCNLSAVRDGIKLSDLPPLVLKPLPSCPEKHVSKVNKSDIGEIDAEVCDDVIKAEVRNENSEIKHDEEKRYSEEQLFESHDDLHTEASEVHQEALPEVPQPYGLAGIPQMPMSSVPEQSSVNSVDPMKLMLLKQNVMAMLTQINPMLATNPVLLEFFANQYLASNQQLLVGQMPTQTDFAGATSLMGVAHMPMVPGKLDASGNPQTGTQPMTESGRSSSSSDPMLSVSPPVVESPLPCKPPGMSDAAAKADASLKEKKEMAGVSGSTRIGRGRGRAKKPAVSHVGSDNTAEDAASMMSGQTASSMFKFGESSSTEFTFRKNAKRVAMTRRDKGAAPVPDAGKRKIEDVQEKVDGWNMGSVSFGPGDADNKEMDAVPSDPVESVTPVEDSTAAVEENAAVSLTASAELVCPEEIPLPPMPHPQENRVQQNIPVERRNSGEDWEEDAPECVTPWKLSTFGPSVLPSEREEEEPKGRDLPPGLPQESSWNQKKSSNSLAAKLQKKKKTEAKAKAKTEPAPTPFVKRGKQLPVVGSSIDTVPVVLNKKVAKTPVVKETVKEKTKSVEPQQPPKVKEQPKVKEPPKPVKKEDSFSGLDNFDVPFVMPKPAADSEWHQVCKKKKKNESTPTPAAVPASADKKSQQNFDKIVAMILAQHPDMTRDDVIGIIKEVRETAGELKGMKRSVMLETANAIIEKRQRNQSEYDGPIIMSNDVALDINEVLVKSEICQYWKKGHCQKGSECHYAHGKEDLRSPPKYILCSSFENGHCPHGSKCLFAHGKKELKAPPADFNVRTRKDSRGSSRGPETPPVDSVVAKAQPWPARESAEDFLGGEPCVICCGGIRPGQGERLNCGHFFHQTCIKRWVVGEERTCPTCRSHVLLEEEFPALN